MGQQGGLADGRGVDLAEICPGGEGHVLDAEDIGRAEADAGGAINGDGPQVEVGTGATADVALGRAGLEAGETWRCVGAEDADRRAGGLDGGITAGGADRLHQQGSSRGANDGRSAEITLLADRGGEASAEGFEAGGLERGQGVAVTEHGAGAAAAGQAGRGLHITNTTDADVVGGVAGRQAPGGDGEIGEGGIDQGVVAGGGGIGQGGNGGIGFDRARRSGGDGRVTEAFGHQAGAGGGVVGGVAGHGVEHAGGHGGDGVLGPGDQAAQAGIAADAAHLGQVEAVAVVEGAIGLTATGEGVGHRGQGEADGRGGAGDTGGKRCNGIAAARCSWKSEQLEAIRIHQLVGGAFAIGGEIDDRATGGCRERERVSGDTLDVIGGA